MHEFTTISQDTGSDVAQNKTVREQDGTMDTVSSGTAGVPLSQDTTNNSVIRNSDHHTNDKISNLRMRPRSAQLHDILGFNDSEQHCLISKCGTKNCKTCNILITDAHFTSNLTNINVVYGLECRVGICR